MSSVGSDRRAEQRDADLSRTPAERVRLALALGAADAERFAAAHRTSAADARRVFQRQRQNGRIPSSSHDQLLA